MGEVNTVDNAGGSVRVLEINSVCGTGSTGRIACQIADVVIQNGDEVTVAYGRSYYAKGCNAPTYKIESNFGVYLHAGLSRITDRQGFYSKRATKKLVSYIKEFKPDVIHIHNIHGYYLHLPTLFNFLSDYNKPVVWTLHDCWAFTGHCAHFDFVGCDKWKTRCHHCIQKKKYPASFFADQSKRNWKEKKALFNSIDNMTIVSPSYWLARQVKESFLQNYPVQIIYNGIDLEVFKPTPSTWKEENGITKPIVLACASFWNERKGYYDVQKLSELLPDFQVVIVGISVKQAIKLPKSIIGIQRTDNIQELVKIYSAAEVFVNPTYEEVLGLVNIEALACGTPVITYDSGGSPETISEYCGAYTEEKTPESLQVSVRRILGMSISISSCVHKAREFNRDIQYLQYLSLYNNLLQR